MADPKPKLCVNCGNYNKTGSHALMCLRLDIRSLVTGKPLHLNPYDERAGVGNQVADGHAGYRPCGQEALFFKAKKKKAAEKKGK